MRCTSLRHHSARVQWRHSFTPLLLPPSLLFYDLFLSSDIFTKKKKISSKGIEEKDKNSMSTIYSLRHNTTFSPSCSPDIYWWKDGMREDERHISADGAICIWCNTKIEMFNRWWHCCIFKNSKDSEWRIFNVTKATAHCLITLTKKVLWWCHDTAIVSDGKTMVLWYIMVLND